MKKFIVTVLITVIAVMNVFGQTHSMKVNKRNYNVTIWAMDAWGSDVYDVVAGRCVKLLGKMNSAPRDLSNMFGPIFVPSLINDDEAKMFLELCDLYLGKGDFTILVAFGYRETESPYSSSSLMILMQEIDGHPRASMCWRDSNWRD